MFREQKGRLRITRAAGLIIFRIRENTQNEQPIIEFLLVNSRQRSGRPNWTPPKGICESQESPRYTAVRETTEETGLIEEHLEIYDDISFKTEYRANNSLKYTTYFLAQLKESAPCININGDEQIIDFAWDQLPQAQERARYQEMQDLLNDAHEIILNDILQSSATLTPTRSGAS